MAYCSRSEMTANKVLKKFKYQSGDFIFSKSSTWRSSPLEELMRPVNNERTRIHAEMASEQLLEGYLLQYNNLCIKFLNHFGKVKCIANLS